jgi:tetratricopeptide (TPR) repeat protein
VGDAAALAGYQRPNGPANEPLETMFAAHMALLGGDAPAALGLINRYIETAEGASYGFSYRGRVNAVLGRREAALADLRRAVDIEPSFVGACRALADAEFKAGRPEVAIAAIRRCVAHAAAPARAMAQLLARLHMPPDMLARIEAEVAVPDGPGRTLLAREMVILAFQLILGREPENETVIEAHRKAGTILGLRRTLLGSPEFEQKYRKQFATG